jgi:hypothetical protein
MRAIEAGSIAGGDVRCNQGSIRQTTSMAALLVAREGDAPYAAENIGMTDAGTPAAPWLALSVRTGAAGRESPSRDAPPVRRVVADGGQRRSALIRCVSLDGLNVQREQVGQINISVDREAHSSTSPSSTSRSSVLTS